ncbi:MAG: hypothetical protein S0880_35340 [Actinomycetota bacterium]|nr:hypothetical protein [Actinomycetota bacterium]
MMMRLRLQELVRTPPRARRAEPVAWALAGLATVAGVAVVALTLVRADAPPGAVGVVLGLAGVIALAGGLLRGAPGGVSWATTALTTGYVLAVAGSENGGDALEAPLVGVLLVVVAVVGTWSFDVRRPMVGRREVLGARAVALVIVTGAGAAASWLVLSIGLAGAARGLGVTVAGLSAVVMLTALGAGRLRRLG